MRGDSHSDRGSELRNSVIECDRIHIAGSGAQHTSPMKAGCADTFATAGPPVMTMVPENLASNYLVTERGWPSSDVSLPHEDTDELSDLRSASASGALQASRGTAGAWWTRDPDGGHAEGCPVSC